MSQTQRFLFDLMRMFEIFFFLSIVSKAPMKSASFLHINTVAKGIASNGGVFFRCPLNAAIEKSLVKLPSDDAF